MDIQQLQQQLTEILQESEKISDEEKQFLLENIALFNQEELEALIKNNQ